MDSLHTITFLGCGKISTAVLKGLLRALTKPTTNESTANSSQTTLQINRIITCVRSEESAQRLRQLSPTTPKIPFEVRVNDNEASVRAADIVILGCKPWETESLLTAPGMREAFAGKILLSIVGSASVAELRTLLGQDTRSDQSRRDVSIIRFMPSVAAAVGESVTTVMDDPRHFPPSEDVFEAVVDILSLVGQVERVSQSTFNAATTVCSSGPAFAATLIGAYAKAAEGQGLDRSLALRMAAKVFEGTAKLMLEEGLSVEDVCVQVATPGGPTSVGLERLRSEGLQRSLDGVLKQTVDAMAKHPDELEDGR